MLEVIQNAMKKETKPTFHGGIGSIQSLSDMTKRELSRLLDKESKDWKRLAKLCELGPTVVEYLQEKSAPTICLLDYLAVRFSSIVEYRAKYNPHRLINNKLFDNVFCHLMDEYISHVE